MLGRFTWVGLEVTSGMEHSQDNGRSVPRVWIIICSPAASKLINNKYSGWLLLKEVFFHLLVALGHASGIFLVGSPLGRMVIDEILAEQQLFSFISSALKTLLFQDDPWHGRAHTRESFLRSARATERSTSQVPRASIMTHLPVMGTWHQKEDRFIGPWPNHPTNMRLSEE